MLFSIQSAFLVLLLAVTASAQIGGGSIVGIVKDPTGAHVPGVQVRAHNQGTNEERQVTTNADGYYEFALLPAGTYQLKAEAPGFDKMLGEAFDLAAGTRPRIDFTLQVGSLN